MLNDTLILKFTPFCVIVRNYHIFRNGVTSQRWKVFCVIRFLEAKFAHFSLLIVYQMGKKLLVWLKSNAESIPTIHLTLVCGETPKNPGIQKPVFWRKIDAERRLPCSKG